MLKVNADGRIVVMRPAYRFHKEKTFMPELCEEERLAIDITVIVPAVNAPLIGVTIESLLAQTTARTWEAIIVGVFEPSELPQDARIRYDVTTAPLSAGGNRNRALSVARGRYVLFTDADCRASPDWLDRLAARLDEGHTMVGGAFDFPKDNFWVTGENMAILNNLSTDTTGGRVDIRVGGGNMGLLREALVMVGGFDESFRGGQDNDVAIKLLKTGHTIYFEPTAVMDHLHPGGSFAELKKHATTYGTAAVALIQRHPDYYGWERIRALWRFRWLFLAWSPFKACEQSLQVFLGNPSWRRYWYVWPAVWSFYWYRRVAMAKELSALQQLDRAPVS